MSDIYPLPKNIPQGPDPNALPPAQGVAQQIPDLAKMVSTRVAGSPNYQALKPPTTGPTATGSPLLDKIMAGISSFDQTFMKANPSAKIARTVTGLIPGVNENIDEAIQNTEGLRQANPTASTIGKIGGIVGSSLQPSIAAPATIPGIAANAAVTMAPYSALSGIDTLSQGGNLGDAAKNALASEALGVAGGTALGGLGLVFGKLAKAAHPILNEIDAASYGVTGGDIAKPGMQFAKKMGLNPTGYQATHGATQLDKVMELLRTEGGRGTAGLQKATGWINDQYDSVNQLFKQSGAQLADKVPDILSSPIVQTMKGKFNPTEVDNTINLLVQNADKRIAAGPKGWSDARNFLNDQMQAGIQISRKAEGGNIADVMQKSGMGEMLQDSAAVVKAHMNELTGHVLSEAGAMGKEVPNLEALDQIYGAYPSLQKSLARRAGKPMSSFAGGSESTAGLGSAAAMGGLIGGPAGAAAGKVLGATAMAPLLKRGVGYATNQVMGRSAQWMDSLLQKLSKMKTTGETGAATRLIGAGLNAPAGGGGVGDLLNGPTMQPGPAMGQAHGQQPPITPTDQQAIVPSGAVPISNAPMGQPEPAPLNLETQANDNFLHPEKKEPYMPGFNPSIIDDRLRAMYTIHQKRLGSFAEPFDQFVESIRQGTNNFDPNNEATWSGMLDSQEDAARLYKAHIAMNKLDGVHLENVMNYYTQPFARVGGTRLGSDVGRAQEMNHSKLIAALHGMGLGDPKEIDTRLKQIAWNPKMSDKEKTSSVIDWIIKEGGVDVPRLIQLGLWK